MSKRRKQRAKADSPEHARDLETIRIVTAVLAEHPVDLTQLRKLAAVRGLVNSQLRRRAWPLLLGVQLQPFNEATYQQQATGKHRDSQVVRVDVERSLWAYTKGWSDEARDAKRQQLSRVLTATVVSAADHEVYYYQGMHDIASVLLMTGGERFAFILLRHLTTCQLRDCTRSTLDAVLEQLALIVPILQQTDAELAQYIVKAGLLPYFALSWYITWFAHDVQNLDHVARLYDLFVSSHPLMPLYVGAVAMRASREQLLAISGDGPEIHSALSKLRIVGTLSTEQLAQQAVTLFKRSPPQAVMRRARCRLQWSVAPGAQLRDGHWTVPEAPVQIGYGRSRKRQWATALVSASTVAAAVVGASILLQLNLPESLGQHLL